MSFKLPRMLACLPLRKAIAAAFVSVAGFLLAPVFAQGSDLALLDSLQKGAWELRFRDGSPGRKICVRTGREFIQLRHNASQCGRYVVERESSEVTVQYSCKGDGYGRTNIRKETSALVQIEGQGISGGLPYQFTAEARRTGSC